MGWWQRLRGGTAREPRDADAAFREALLAVLARDFERAEQCLARAASLDSSSVMPFIAIGRLFRARGEVGRAIQTHHNLLVRADLTPRERVDALAELAADFRQGGFLRRAVAGYEEVVAHDRSHREALGALTRLYADLRDFDRALEVARRHARLEGSDDRAVEVGLLVEQAEAARTEGRDRDARKALRKALRIDPGSARAWLALGEVEAEGGDNKKALEAWRRVPACDPRAAVLVYPRLASAYAALDRARDFEAFLAAFLERHPDDVPARLALARALAARGETGDALAEARRVLERNPDALEAHGVLGRVLLETEQPDEVAKGYAELLAALERRSALEASEDLA